MMPTDALSRVRAARGPTDERSSCAPWQPDELTLAVKLRAEYGMCSKCVAVFLELHGYPVRTARGADGGSQAREEQWLT